MYLGKQIAFCAPTTSLSVVLIEEACAWTTKNIRSCNISTKKYTYIYIYTQTMGDFSAGNKPFCIVFSHVTVKWLSTEISVSRSDAKLWCQRSMKWGISRLPDLVICYSLLLKMAIDNRNSGFSHEKKHVISNSFLYVYQRVHGAIGFLSSH